MRAIQSLKPTRYRRGHGPLLQQERPMRTTRAHMPGVPPSLTLISTKYARPTALNQLRE